MWRENDNEHFKELGWTYSTARHCQAIRDANKQKRLDWCTNHIAKKRSLMISSSQMNLHFNWSAIEGSASVKRCPESSSTSTSIRRKYMCGLAYRSEVPQNCDVPRDHDGD